MGNSLWFPCIDGGESSSFFLFLSCFSPVNENLGMKCDGIMLLLCDSKNVGRMVSNIPQYLHPNEIVHCHFPNSIHVIYNICEF